MCHLLRPGLDPASHGTGETAEHLLRTQPSPEDSGDQLLQG